MFGQFAYRTGAGFNVYTSTPKHRWDRPVPLSQLPKTSTIYLVAHFSEASGPVLDSRRYLNSPSDGRVVSTHYLAGQWQDQDGGAPAIIKYGSENTHFMATQGFGLLGDLLFYDHTGSDWTDGLLEVHVSSNLNAVAIGYEIEANPTPTGMPSPWLLNCVTSHMAEIINYWDKKGYDVLLIGHKHTDSAKSDPQLNWRGFVKQVYSQV